MRITLITWALQCGGAERVLATLARQLAARCHAVTVVVLASREKDFYTLGEDVEAVYLDSDLPATGLGRLRRLACRLGDLRRACIASRPDVVVSFMAETNTTALLALARSGLPVVISERCDPRLLPLSPPWPLLRRLLYPRAARLVSVSAGVDRCFRWLPRRRRRVIPNPAAPAESGERPRLPDGGRILGLGRLSRQKGFDIAVRALAALGEQARGWHLVFLGEGRQRHALEALAARLGVAGQVHLPGEVKAPGAWLQGADIFVLPSRFEGFPNALLEAMAAGLPVVAADCPSGPREIVRDGEDGLLVPPGDVAALAAALERLIAFPAERERFGARAADVLQRFGVRRFTEAWEEVLAEAGLRGFGATP